MRRVLRALRSWCKQAGEHEEGGRRGWDAKRWEGARRDGMGWKGGRMGAGKGGMRREWNAREMKREGTGPVGALDWKVRCKGTEMRRGGINGRGWESGAGPRMCPGALCSRVVAPLTMGMYVLLGPRMCPGAPHLAGRPEGRNAGPPGRLT